MLKSDHFLADANWEMVDKSTEIENPYWKIMESVHVSVCVYSTILYLPILQF